MKKLISILLCAAMLLSLAAFTASAAEYDGRTVILYTANLAGDLSVYPHIAALKADFEAKGADVVLLDAGNYMRGSAAANSTMGAAVIDLMNAVGYDAAGMGLGEFSYGDAQTGMIYHGNVTRYYTQKMLAEGTDAVEYNVNRDGSLKATLAARDAAGFAFLASNVEANGDYFSFRESVVIETASGLRVGVFSLTDPAILPNLQDGLVESVSSGLSVPAMDCDVTVCLTYEEGTPDSRLAVISSAGEKTVGALVIDNETLTVSPLGVTLSGSDPEIAKLAESAGAAASNVVGHSDIILNARDSVVRTQETNFGDLVTDALVWYAENYFDGIDKSLPIVAIQNGGNIDQFIYPGVITETDLLRALPFSPMGIGAVELTGAQLLETLEAATSPSERYGELQCPGFAQVSGLKYTVNRDIPYDAGEAYGNFYRADSVARVAITEVNGAAFDPEARYLVIADNYIMNGSDTYYTVKEARDAGAKYVNNGNGIKTRSVVAMYIENVLGTVGERYALPQGRITRAAVSFTDVKVTDYFYSPVIWAVSRGITKGTEAGRFSPDAECTRAQFVTFLWRAAGSPAVDAAENPFEDVAGDSPYLDAILWAVSEGITTGKSASHFDPDGTVSRAQAVTFLMRYAGAEPAGTDNPFEDVPAGQYYTDAVLWAAANGIAHGKSASNFDPESPCTRAQTVTFLARALK